MTSASILQGDCLTVLATLPDQSVQCCVTSPPYYGLRDYGVDGQIGLEPTPDAYVAKLVAVFREVRRVLRDDGTLWLNLGDSYAGSGGAGGDYAAGGLKEGQPKWKSNLDAQSAGLKPKDLVGIPWMVAFALRADGWFLKQDIIWHKPNPMPESVKDRCTKAHEYIFLLAKSQKYYYDAEAVSEPYTAEMNRWGGQKLIAKGESDWDNGTGQETYRDRDMRPNPSGRNRRSVWTVTTKPFKGAHFATFPPDLIEPCILAGTSEKGACPVCGKCWVRITETNGSTRKQPGVSIDYRPENKGRSGRCGEVSVVTVGWMPSCNCEIPAPEGSRVLVTPDAIPCVVLDPFNGAGTTGLVAIQHGREYIGIELNPDYIEMTHKRLAGVQVEVI